MERKGDVLYNVLDQYTGEYGTYKKVTTLPGGTAITDADCDGIVYRKYGSEYFKLNYGRVVDPERYGVVGDGIVDDTVRFQYMLDKVRPYTTISLKSGSVYNVSNVNINRPFIDITGNGASVLGTIKVGDDAVGKTYNCHISGIRFTTTDSAVQLINTRRVYIESNFFSGNNKSIEVLPTTINTQHITAQIEINKNTFAAVNYCFYVGRTTNNTWQNTSDCSFEGNTVNSALITAVYCNGIDGLKYNNNVLFFPSDTVNRVNKKNHLRIEEQSDWVIVSGNNFFESGEESIYLVGCKALTCIGNNFAWTGQKGVYSVINLTGSVTDYNITVSGNTFDSFSGSVLSSASTTYGILTCIGNTITYLDTFSGYFGSTDLSTITHYILDLGSNFVRFREKNAFNNVTNLRAVKIATFVGSVEREGYSFSRGTIEKKVTFTAATPANLAVIHNGALGLSAVYSGELLIIAKNAQTASANTSTYKLILSRFNTTLELVEVFRAGLLTGGAASHPSFIFSLDTSGNLIATPIGSTALLCYFTIHFQGDIAINEA